MTTRRAFALALTVAALAAAVAAPVAKSTQNVASPTLQTKTSRFGKLLFDGRGFVLYAFTSDKVGGKSTCYGDCAAAWPPYVLKGKRSVARGLERSLLGRRSAATGSSRSRTQADPSTTTAATRSPDTSSARTCSSTAGGGSWSRAPASSSADIRRETVTLLVAVLPRRAAVGSLYVTANGPTLPQAELLPLAGKMAARMTRP